ncbi:LAFE_0B05028g1_1 [Lachancea fermentati]|uniref:3-oxoacyl-[acyl-carrier-protein] synthase n=1 Tax=Lachancea fermentati TaxID=4955 RepID=A0A1G4M7S8_LACFM|nr:LAFE_0B05028g1_1 [Lachancea fermentati]
MSRRVVVTGLGALTPLGNSLKESWNSLLAGKSGIVSTSSLNNAQDYASHCPPTVTVGKVQDFDPKNYGDLFSTQDQRRMSLFTLFAIATAQEALGDAGLLQNRFVDRDRFGCVIGSGIASIHDTYDTIMDFSAGKRVSPTFVPKILNNMAAGNVSIKFQLRGVSHCASTACATGNNSIGDAYNFIRLGYNDICLAGASEASVHPLALQGFLRAKSITPTGISRPFDSERDGFVLGEGCGIAVLESLEHAQRRGARIYAEVAGYGLSSDAHHITSPLESGDGARRAMQMALGDYAPDKVGYVNAHATSTVLGDRAEVNAIKNVFGGNRNSKLFVSSNKGNMGHLLGAAGAVESIFTIKSLHHDVIPPTHNLDDIDPTFEVQSRESTNMHFVKGQPLETSLKLAINNSFGFGGVNSCILYKKWENDV